MSKQLEVGSTLSAVAVFVVLLAAAGALGLGRWGVVAALAAFVLLVSAAGYLITEEKYDVEAGEAGSGGDAGSP